MGDYDSETETLEHIKVVRQSLFTLIRELESRGQQHDLTKLGFREKAIFGINLSKLKTTSIGSDEYKECLTTMKPALDHHPEHFRI